MQIRMQVSTIQCVDDIQQIAPVSNRSSTVIMNSAWHVCSRSIHMIISLRYHMINETKKLVFSLLV